jgi:hypothetical protein
MDSTELMKALQKNFTQAQVSWKPQSVKDGKALAVAFIDARDVMTRLDDVVGPGGWQSEFIPVGNNSVECRLKIKIGDEWIAKCDVGATSDQPDAGDKMKAAYSDALKRAAVQWGIGRSIYQLPLQWVPANGKYLASEPQLPKWYKDGQQSPIDGSKPTPPPAPEAKVEPVVKINQDQMTKIEKLISIAKVDLNVILDHYKVKSVGELDFDTASKCIARLKISADKAMEAAGKEAK